MPLPHHVELPTEEELNVSEVNLSMAALYAAAFHLGKICESQNNEFILCREELADPRKCLNEGKEVTKCALDFFKNIKKECRRQFDEFAICLHKNSRNWEYHSCRKTQAAFDKCVLDKLGIERPPWGWYSEVHIHETKREKPQEEKLFPDPPEQFDPNVPKKSSRYKIRTMQ